MIAEPIISPDFTIEDIHKIREYHYELTKDMTTQEKINFYNEGGRAFLAEMEGRKLQNEKILDYSLIQFEVVGKEIVEIRKYRTSDCEGLFYNTVHTANVKDYKKEQLDVWVT